MNNKIQEYLKIHKHLSWWQKVCATVSCFVVFCVVYALILPVITQERPLICNIEEHQHTEVCYTDDLVCGEEELHEHSDECYEIVGVGDLLCEFESHTHGEECFNEDEELICEIQEHEHSSECFEGVESNLVCTAHIHNNECVEKVLVCHKEEHTHIEECYGSAIPEHDDEKWLSVLPEIRGDYRADIADIVLSQLDNKESHTDFVENGNGYTLYGNAYGMPYTDWDSAFVRWSIEKAGIVLNADSEIPFVTPEDFSSTKWFDNLNNIGYVQNVSDEGIIAKVGDIIFADLNEDGDVDHVGIITGVVYDFGEDGVTLVNGKISAVFGDLDNCVKEVEFNKADERICGFVAINESEAQDYYDAVIGAIAYSGYPYEVNEFISNNMPWLMLTAFNDDVSLLADQGENYFRYLDENNTIVETVTTALYWHNAHEGGETASMTWNKMVVGEEIPVDAHLRFEVNYSDIDPAMLKNAEYTLYYIPDDYLASLIAESAIKVAGEDRGIISSTVMNINGEEKSVITLKFDKDWVDDLVKHNSETEVANNKKSIYGDFYYQAEFDLKKLEEAEQREIMINGITVLPKDPTDAVAQFADVDIKKQADPVLVKGDDGSYYLKYTLTITAGQYGAPDIKVIDSISSGSNFVDGAGFVSVSGSPVTALRGDDANPLNAPVETVRNGGDNPHSSEAYLSHCTADNLRDFKANPSAYEDRISTDGNIIKPIGSNSGNNLVWYIGDMQPEEVRTLTYLVKVAENYIGVPHTNQVINNDANLFSKGYPRGFTSKPYTPEIQTNMSKTFNDENNRNTMRKDEATNKWYVDYTITVDANRNNAYKVTNLKITDAASGRSGDYSDRIKIVEGSVKLYDSTGRQEIDTSDLHDGANPIYKADGRDFDIYIGDLEPGEVKKIKYTMELDAADIEAYANGIIGIHNQAKLISDETKPGGGQELVRRDVDISLDNQTWTRKLGGDQIREATTLNFDQRYSNNVYDLTSGTLRQISMPSAPYTINSGMTRYTIVVNEDGDWDVTGANLRDNLGTTRIDNQEKFLLQFDGYIELKVYDRVPQTNDEQYIIDLTGNKTPEAIYYIKIDNLTSFNLKLSDLGLGDANAYVLTYYAKPNSSVSGWTQADVTNSFYMDGTVVGPSGHELTLFDNIYSSKTKHLIEAGTEQPTKKRWYYDPSYRFINNYSIEKRGYDDEFPHYNENGAQYWVITFSGQKINKDTQIQDSTRVSGSWDNNHEIRANGTVTTLPLALLRYSDSFVGLYSGALGKNMETGVDYDLQDKYENIDAINRAVANGELTEVPSDFYSTRWSQGDRNYNGASYVPRDDSSSNFFNDKDGNPNFDFTVQFDKEYAFQSGEKLYLILRTQPAILPGPESVLTYLNKLNFKYGGSNSWDDGNSRPVPMTIYGDSTGLQKRVQGVYEITGGAVNNIISGAKGIDVTSNTVGFRKSVALYKNDQVSGTAITNRNGDNYTLSDGMYLSWLITGNTNASLSGRYSIIDNIPDGLEIAYVRAYSAGWRYNEREKYYLNGSYMLPENLGPDTRIVYSKKNDGTTYKDLNYGSGSKVAFIFSRTNEDLKTDGWDEYYVNTRATDFSSSSNFAGTYYYVKDNQLRIESDFTRGVEPVTYQVVFKINDEGMGLLEYGDQEFNNQSEMIDQYGRKVAESGSTITVKGGNVDKTSLTQFDQESINGNLVNNINTTVFPYKIVLNENAVNMDSDDTTNGDIIGVPLIDRMTSNLSLQTNSIKIYKSVGLDGKNLADYLNAVSSTAGSSFYVENLNRPRTNTNSWWLNYANFFKINENGTRVSAPGVTNNDISVARNLRELQNSILVVGANGQEVQQEYNKSENKFTTDQAVNYEYQTGTYVTYLVSVSGSQAINGSVNVVDELPAGLELCYVRTYSGVTDSNGNPTYSGNYGFVGSYQTANLRIQATGESSVFDGWNTGAVASNMVDGTYWMNTFTNYYYTGNSTDGYKVGINVRNLRNGTTPVFQIVCRVVDDTGFVKNNMQDEVYFVDKNGDKIDEDASGKLIYYGGTWSNSEKDIGKPWYTTDTSKVGSIVGNLTDETNIVVSTKPSLDENDMPVIDSSGKQMKDVWFENLPDRTALRVEYNVTANLSSSEKNSIKNDAFWKGYEKNEGGSTEIENISYTSVGSAGTTSHGALVVHKYDSSDVTAGLKEAVFELYRAEYVLASNNHVFLTSGGKEYNPEKGHHYIAIFRRTPGDEPGEEVYIKRDSNGIITHYKYDEGDPWIAYLSSDAEKFTHKLALDENGNLKLCSEGVLAVGWTNEDGFLSYGLSKNMGSYLDENYNPVQENPYEEDRIHFNKVYCIIETRAPQGYQVDMQPHFFVIPNDKSGVNGAGKNYFYHESWPDGVQVVSSNNETPTYEIEISNTRKDITVSKEFGGTKQAHQPGTYSFAIYSEENGPRANNTNMIEKVSITYTEDDFGYYHLDNENSKWSKYYTKDNKWYRDNYQISDSLNIFVDTEELEDFKLTIDGDVKYGLLPNHIKSAKFSKLDYGTYYVFELNDAGYPLTSSLGETTGTINGIKYTVTVNTGDSTNAYGEIDYSLNNNQVIVKNTSYTVDLIKTFHSLTNQQLPEGLTGEYKFAIWPEDEIGANGLPTTPATVANTKTLTWAVGDVDSQKMVTFSGLQGGKIYHIFELDNNNNPISNGKVAEINGSSYLVEYKEQYGNTKSNAGFTISGTHSEVKAENYAVVQLPSTGGSGSRKLIVLGTVLVTISAAQLLEKVRRRKK